MHKPYMMMMVWAHNITIFKRTSLSFKRHFFILWFTIIFFVIVPKSYGTVYYVSPSGSDNSTTGSRSAPYKTIKKGISKATQPGDTVYVRTGTYVEKIYIGQSGNSKLPISLLAYPGESPIIDGQTSLPGYNWGYLMLVEGNYLNIRGFEVKNCNVNGTYSGGIAIIIQGCYCKVSNMNVHHVWENGIVAHGDYSTVENCRIWQCSLANSKKPGSVNWSSGLSAARSSSDGIATNVTLKGNTVYNNWGEGLSTYEAEGTRIQENIVYDNWSANIYISDTRGATVERNIVYNTPNNLVGRRSSFMLGDEKSNVPRSANNKVFNNLIYNCDLWAFWSSIVSGSGLDNVIISHNTLVNGQLEIGANSTDGIVNKSAYINNNIFINANGTPYEVKGSLTNLNFSNNFWSAKPPSGLSSSGDVIGDPLLAKTGETTAGKLTADYFNLLVNSPAINKGVAVSYLTQDYFKKAFSGTPDIGAFEFIEPITKITVTSNNGSSEIITKSGTLQLKAIILPTNASNPSVKWSITNKTGKAKISTTGLVTAIANGTVEARATANDGTGKYGTFAITISNQGILVTNISIASSTGTSAINTNKGTLQLIASATPTDATNKSVTWSITNKTGKASISSTGLVTAIANGTVEAKATAKDGSGKSAILVITISKQIVLVSNISITTTGGVTSVLTGKTLQLTKTVLPTGATNPAITWSIINKTGKATINSSGLLSAIEEGTINVIAKALDGSQAIGSCPITIINQPAVTDINIYQQKGMHIALSKNNLRISFDGQNDYIKSCSIYDLQGKLIYQEKLNQETININTSGFIPGIYIVNIINASHNIIPVKIIIP